MTLDECRIGSAPASADLLLVYTNEEAASDLITELIGCRRTRDEARAVLRTAGLAEYVQMVDREYEVAAKEAPPERTRLRPWLRRRSA